MITVRTISVALMAIALVASSAGSARAGGGGLGTLGDQVFFQCYFIEQGVKATTEIEVNDQFTNPTQFVPGKARMLCAPADGTPVTGQLTALPPFAGDHLMCYDIPGDTTANAVVAMEDPLGTQTVKTGPRKFVCVGAIKTCVSGCPVIGP